jgi:histidinol-phosphate aminotransferase
LSTIIEREVLNFILERVPPEILVLLDEAYVDYSDGGNQWDLVSQHPNVMVLRTFSKIYGLAGLRVGYGVAHASIIQALMKAKPTWNIGLLAATGALAALEDREHYDRTRSLVRQNKDYLVGQLSGFSNLSIVMKPQANFLCLRIMDPAITSTQLFERLLERGVIIKDCSVSYKGLGDRFVRVDVSLRSKMDVFLERLAEVLS